MDVNALYERWLKEATADPDLIGELRSIAGQEDAIFDRFYRQLDFGTAGLRGIIGAGDNRMNVYTVGKATQGLADYLLAHYDAPAVAIAYDSRIKSDVFARVAARVLAANGVKAYLFDELQPTPVLSFAVRRLRCQSGIVVTASHNPAAYNGYKCYSAAGYQMTDDEANAVTACIRKLDIFNDIRTVDFDAAVADGRIEPVGQALVDEFLDEVEKAQVNPGICRQSPAKVVYTPLNGTGNKPVRAILKRIGVENVTVVPEQEQPDGNFPTAPYPNPEIRQAFEKALALAETERPDLLLATDPDCDRVGIAVPDGKGDYVLFSGNETGCMLLEYILSCKQARGEIPADPFVVKTIVTSPLAAKIAEHYGCKAVDVLTGFKYIGEQIEAAVQAGHPERYIFGFEESYGYLAGTHARDKDAVVASMLICEMAAYYRSQGKSLLEMRRAMYDKYGVYQNTVVNKAFEGAQGMAAMQALMARLRDNRPASIAGRKVIGCADYQLSVETDLTTGKTKTLTLPKSNVLAYSLEGDAKLIVRPSGTEPKIKAYLTASGATDADASALTAALTEAAGALLTE
ncbi:MAG: phospho-sugar mutase [Acutalibacteraceae bacterium]|jgi:phosphoglucomutase